MTPATQGAAPLARYREMWPGDVSFVFHSWLNSHAKWQRLEHEAKARYFTQQHAVLEVLLRRSRVLVACDPAAPAEVWGYLVFEETPRACVVHWLYTKRLFRGLGLARRLVETAQALAPKPLQHTHETQPGKKLAAKWGSTFNPDAAR